MQRISGLEKQNMWQLETQIKKDFFIIQTKRIYKEYTKNIKDRKKNRTCGNLRHR